MLSIVVLNLSNFRHMNGAIHRNAQTISPVSDLHTTMAESSPIEQGSILTAINSSLSDQVCCSQVRADNDVLSYRNPLIPYFT